MGLSSCMKHGGDGTDMTIAPDVYLDWRDEFDFMDGTPLLSLRYCSAEELPEKQKTRKAKPNRKR